MPVGHKCFCILFIRNKPGEIQQKAREVGVRDQQIEKDYVLSWILKGVAQHEQLSKCIVFKGGTVLKKIYFEDYRFSEDLDFTLLNNEIPNEQMFVWFKETFEYVREEANIPLEIIDNNEHEDGGINFSEDFFGRATNLTVSGQLEGELAAMAFSDIYTFGPTFRAENSNTTRHLAEFWMIEPEVAFNDLEDNMNLAEAFIKYVIKHAMDNNKEDLEFLAQRLEEEEKQKPQIERSEMGLIDKLNFVVDNDFERLTYTEAIAILRECNHNKKKKFTYLIDGWGVDLQSEHERYLVEKHFKKPVILTDYPKEIKAFYMRQNDDGKTVAAMDILAPGIGEIVGGSQREERLDKLTQRMEEMHIPAAELWWYLDTRKFGACPHAGFGLGFERLVQFVTGMGNIRDVIPFPRYPKSAEF